MNYEEMPTNIKPIGKYNMSMHSYIELMNKMSIDDIMMHHSSSVVFEIMEQTYNRTKDLYASVEISFRKILEGE
jgi:hypothetical protein